MTDLQREDHQPYDILDTWQAPIVATTFNQLFRALFPARAQQCLRIPALDGAFLFIDEPQIVTPPSGRLSCGPWPWWSAATAQALFCTATLPPVIDGLGDYGPVRPLVETSPRSAASSSDRWNPGTPAEWWRGPVPPSNWGPSRSSSTRSAMRSMSSRSSKEGGRWFFLAPVCSPVTKSRSFTGFANDLRESPIRSAWSAPRFWRPGWI